MLVSNSFRVPKNSNRFRVHHKIGPQLRRLTIYNNGHLVYQAATLMPKLMSKITNKVASSIVLVRFTWTRAQALQKLNELSNKIPATNF